MRSSIAKYPNFSGSQLSCFIRIGGKEFLFGCIAFLCFLDQFILKIWHYRLSFRFAKGRIHSSDVRVVTYLFYRYTVATDNLCLVGNDLYLAAIRQGHRIHDAAEIAFSGAFGPGHRSRANGSVSPFARTGFTRRRGVVSDNAAYDR